LQTDLPREGFLQNMKHRGSDQKRSQRTAPAKRDAVRRGDKSRPLSKPKSKRTPPKKMAAAPRQKVAVSGSAKSVARKPAGHKHKESSDMAPRKELRLNRAPRARAVEAAEAEPSAQDFLGQQAAPEKGRYRLQVDRQTKASYPTQKAAQEAGLAIKRAFPIVHVAIFDADEGMSTTIALPA
jgi:hypothetical protein